MGIIDQILQTKWHEVNGNLTAVRRTPSTGWWPFCAPTRPPPSFSIATTPTDGGTSCLDAGDGAYYYLQNTLYSVYGLADAGGAVVEGYSYDPYGKHTLYLDGPDADGRVNFDGGDDLRFSEGRSPRMNPYGFTGRRFDRETGLWHYRNRYYDGERFITRDSLAQLFLQRTILPQKALQSYKDATIEQYAYAKSNPIRYYDWSGLMSAEQYRKCVTL